MNPKEVGYTYAIDLSFISVNSTFLSELQQLQDILQIGDPDSNPTTIRQLGPDDDHRPFLKEIKLSTDNCLILHCSPENLLNILEQANELKMLGEYQVK